jgi:hypothetical protein
MFGNEIQVRFFAVGADTYNFETLLPEP